VAKPDRSVNKAVVVRNRQRGYAVDLRLLREIARSLLQELLQREAFEVGIYVIAAPEMAGLNQTYLHHLGSTDVLAFDYTEAAQPEMLRGEVFVCVDEARAQSLRFRTTWQSELVRYVAHGILHLCGYDDHRSVSRRKMKRKEAQVLTELANRFPFSKLGKSRKKPQNVS
jgi:rRNA maturation RNase YbeY